MHLWEVFIDMVISALDFFRNTDTLYSKGRNYANATVNVYAHKCELVLRSQFMDVSPKTVGDRSRHFELTPDGYIQCKDTRYTLSDYFKSRKRSRARALDTVHGLLRANKWDFFGTFTFDPERIDRMNDDAVVLAFSRFRDKLRKLYPDFKMIALPEYHEKGALHFHAVLSGNLENLLVPAFSAKTGEPLFTKFGDRICNMPLFEYGFNSFVRIKDQQYDRIANYITKYCTKDMTLMPNKKSYYASRNLIKRERLIRYYTPDQIERLLFGSMQRVNKYGEVFDDNPEFIIRKCSDHYIIIDFPHDSGSRLVGSMFGLPVGEQLEIET